MFQNTDNFRVMSQLFSTDPTILKDFQVCVMARGYLDMILAIIFLLAPSDRRDIFTYCSLVLVPLKTPGCLFFAMSISTPMVSMYFSSSSFLKLTVCTTTLHTKSLNVIDIKRISAVNSVIQHLEPKRKLLLVHKRALVFR